MTTAGSKSENEMATSISARNRIDLVKRAELVMIADYLPVIRSMIGAEPDEEAIVTTPQFLRTSDMQGPGAPPITRKEWESLRTMDVNALKEMGLHSWDELDEKGMVLMLFPGEWYPHIPAGFLIEDIYGELNLFVQGDSDDDTRYGYLSYGVSGKATGKQ